MKEKHIIRNCRIFALLFLMLFGTTIGSAPAAFAQSRGQQPPKFTDWRQNRNHSYPARDHFIRHHPPRGREMMHRDFRHQFHRGTWRRTSGGRIYVVGPSVGLIVPFLPAFYVIIRVQGIPYFFADGVYYRERQGGFIVTAPPGDNASDTVCDRLENARPDAFSSTVE